jgi:hypothetical protein
MSTDSKWLEEQMNPTSTRQRGKAQPKIVSHTSGDLDKIYNRVSPYLHPQLRDYLLKRYAGEIPLDNVKEAELLITLLTVYTTRVVDNGIESGTVTKDAAQLIGETRLAIKDHFDMQRKQEEMERKYGDEGRTVNPVRQSSLDIFESFHREPAATPEGSSD